MDPRLEAFPEPLSPLEREVDKLAKEAEALHAKHVLFTDSSQLHTGLDAAIKLLREADGYIRYINSKEAYALHAEVEKFLKEHAMKPCNHIHVTKGPCKLPLGHAGPHEFSNEIYFPPVDEKQK